jgi:hypothetical protein
LVVIAFGVGRRSAVGVGIRAESDGIVFGAGGRSAVGFGLGVGAGRADIFSVWFGWSVLIAFGVRVVCALRPLGVRVVGFVGGALR